MILNLLVADARPPRDGTLRCGVQQATSVREYSHLNTKSLSTWLPACYQFGGKFACKLQKEKRGALLLCNRGPLGTRRARWSYPQCITCILNLVCCVLLGGSGARPGSPLLFLRVR